MGSPAEALMNHALRYALSLSLLLASACSKDEEPEEVERSYESIGVLGDYELSQRGGQLRIIRGDALFWETGPSAVALHQTELIITDERALYTIKEEVGSSCAETVFDEGVLEEGAIIIDGGFAEEGCEDTRFTLRFELVGDQLGFRAAASDEAFNHVTLSLLAPPDEQFYGLGEQFSMLNLRGHDAQVLVQEQGIGRGGPLTSTIGLLRLLPLSDEQKELIEVFRRASGHKFSTYYAAPVTVTDTGRAIMLENTGYTRFDLRGESEIALHAFGGDIHGRLARGERVLGAITEVTELTGRMPELPAWTQEGAILGIQGGTTLARERFDAIRDAGTPIAGLWLQDWVGRRVTLDGLASQLWWNWEIDEEHYPDWSSFIDYLEAEGVRVLGYFNPYLVDVSEKGSFNRNLFAEAEAAGYLVTNAAGELYPVTITDFDAGLVDLTNQEAFDWLKEIIKEQVTTARFSGWMADFGEALPFDAALANGDAAELHNVYPELWARLNREVVEELDGEGELLFFMRAGFTKSPGLSSAFWAGDQNTMWDDADGLKSSIHALIGGGFAGLTMNHSDIGGYTSLGVPIDDPALVDLVPAQFSYIDPDTGQLFAAVFRTEELLLRWAEVNAFTPIFRTHEGLAPELNAQAYDADVVDGFARAAQIFAAFASYREALMEDAETKGWPLVRHPIIHHALPAFREMPSSHLQFLLGEDVMVAPILLNEETERSLWLGEGEWTQLFTGEVFTVTSEGRELTSAAPLGSPPVYVRLENPLVQEAVDSLRASGVIDWD